MKQTFDAATTSVTLETSKPAHFVVTKTGSPEVLYTYTKAYVSLENDGATLAISDESDADLFEHAAAIISDPIREGVAITINGTVFLMLVNEGVQVRAYGFPLAGRPALYMEALPPTNGDPWIIANVTIRWNGAQGNQSVVDIQMPVDRTSS